MTVDRRRADELRTEFDRGFAEPPPAARADTVGLLALQVGEQARAVRIAEVAGLFADRRIVPLPSPAPALLGLAGFRGAVLPVYDLRRLLGAETRMAPRWLIVAAAAPVAFAFDGFDGHLTVAPTAIVAGRGEVMVAGGQPRALVALASLLASLSLET